MSTPERCRPGPSDSTDWAHPDPVRLARFAALGASDGDSFENAASRGQVAPGEGWNLRFRAGSRAELLGVPAGVWRRPNVPHAGKVDVGWAENEVGRIKRAAGCRRIAWVLMAHSQGADAVLGRGLAAAGGRVTFEVLSLDASLTRVEFEPPAGDCFPR